jgi:hypothetical protein
MCIVFLSYFILLEYSLSSCSYVINIMLCSQVTVTVVTETIERTVVSTIVVPTTLLSTLVTTVSTTV